MKYLAIAAAASLLVGCTVHQQDDNLNAQIATFRETRQTYNEGLLHCRYLVEKKYHEQLFGAGNLEGPARDAAVKASSSEYRTCSEHYTAKMETLWHSQPPAVKAYYEQRRAEMSKKYIAAIAESKR